MQRKRNRTIALPPLRRLLGGLDPAQFLRDYWQKKPLLVRRAIPELEHWLDPDGLFALAARDEVESRLVRQQGTRWHLEHGPFPATQRQRLPRRNWSLLVQGVNLWLEAGDRLLDRFNFIPYARLDDLMVSFAPAGGGVGPHFDSYDVFLIQGLGRRRWEISGQRDLDLVEDAPLRILQRFRVDESWVLEPGDLLYLPPQYAHNGVALSDCMTWSVGFRAPHGDELAGQFLAYLQDHLNLPAQRYADPDLRPARHPGRIPDAMQAGLRAMLARLDWGNRELTDFIGRHLSEPKAQVFFEPPQRPLSAPRFAERARARGIRLDPRTRLLYDRRAFYLNGETIEVAPALRPHLRELADRREWHGDAADAAPLALLHTWYLDGFVQIRRTLLQQSNKAKKNRATP